MAERKPNQPAPPSSSRNSNRRARSPRKAAEAAAEPEACQHHWQIGRPDAQVSHGVCTKCGEEKDFLNYGEELRMPFGRRRRR